MTCFSFSFNVVWKIEIHVNFTLWLYLCDKFYIISHSEFLKFNGFESLYFYVNLWHVFHQNVFSNKTLKSRVFIIHYFKPLILSDKNSFYLSLGKVYNLRPFLKSDCKISNNTLILVLDAIIFFFINFIANQDFAFVNETDLVTFF